jgi:phytoene synthase
MRTLDDLVDEGDPRAAEELAHVEGWAAGEAPRSCLAPILEELAGRHPGFPRDAVADFCAGMRADLDGVRTATDADLDRYCYQVAGTVGRLMAALLGIRPGREAEAEIAARRLGGAMQRTNILRDLVADAGLGRVYLPDSSFVAAGFGPDELTFERKRELLASLPSLPAEVRRVLVGREIALADADYAAGIAGIGALRRGSRSIAAAGRLYREILRQIERDDYGASGRRAVVPRGRKALLVVRTAVGA